MKKTPKPRKQKIVPLNTEEQNRIFQDMRSGLLGSISSDTVQVGGRHYKSALETQQHWNLVVAYGWDYFTAQVTRYMFRWTKKGGLEDLKKARHYIDKLIELVESGWMPEGMEKRNATEPGPNYTNQD